MKIWKRSRFWSLAGPLTAFRVAIVVTAAGVVDMGMAAVGVAAAVAVGVVADGIAVGAAVVAVVGVAAVGVEVGVAAVVVVVMVVVVVAVEAVTTINAVIVPQTGGTNRLSTESSFGQGSWLEAGRDPFLLKNRSEKSLRHIVPVRFFSIACSRKKHS
jgi:hypothetical protein